MKVDLPSSSYSASQSALPDNTATKTASRTESQPAPCGLATRVNSSNRPRSSGTLPAGIPAGAVFTGDVPKQADGRNPYDVAKFTSESGTEVKIAGHAKPGKTSFRAYNHETHEAARHDVPLIRGNESEMTVRMDAKLNGGGNNQPEELNNLSWKARVNYLCDESLDEVMRYYMNPICPSDNYDELPMVANRLELSGLTSSKCQEFAELMQNASPKRDLNNWFMHADDNNNVNLISMFRIKPPTDRLGGLYSGYKLDNILSAINEDENLPPVALKRSTDPDFDYEVQDGIHRYYATVQKGWGKLPCVVE